MQAVPRMANLFKEFLLEIVSSQFKRIHLTVSEGRIVWLLEAATVHCLCVSQFSYCAASFVLLFPVLNVKLWIAK